MPSRQLVPAAVTLLLLVGLSLFLFLLPLRPTAWGGPRGAGPFEDGNLPGAGGFARDARLGLESFARWRSPDRPLAATAEALQAYYALLAIARYGILWLMLRRLGGSGCLAAVAVVAAAAPLAFGAPRHDETDVGLLLFVALLACVSGPRIPWWLAAGVIPVLFVAWANAHTSVLVGLAWLMVVTVGRAVEGWRERNAATDDSAWRRLAVALVLGAAAVCLNPDGPRVFVDAIAATKNPNMAALTGWQPVDFSKPAGMPWAYFATLVALLLAQLASPRAMSPTALLVLLSFGFWPLVQQRGLAYWWLIVPWLLIPLVRPLISRPDMKARLPRWWTGVVGGLIAAAVLTTPAARWILTGRPRPLDRSVSAATPARVALELTADEAEAGNHLPDLRDTLRLSYPDAKYRGAILTGLEQGDFLAWGLDGDLVRPVMLYTRPETLEPLHWAEALGALQGGPDWWEVLGRHQVNLVVIDPGKWEKLAGRLRESKAWRTVQDDGPGGLLVAVRREPKLPAELIP